MIEVLSREELLVRRRQVPYDIGIYVLFAGDQIVYVGQSASNVMGRVLHHATNKAFDSYAFIPVTNLTDLTLTEATYIWEYCPPYNMQVPHNPRFVGKKEAAKRLGLETFQFKRLCQRNGITPHMDCYDMQALEAVISSSREEEEL